MSEGIAVTSSEPVSEIENQIKNIAVQLTFLQDNIDCLIRKLEPIRMPPPAHDKIGVNKIEFETPTTQLGLALHEFVLRLDSYNEIINNIRRSLAI